MHRLTPRVNIRIYPDVKETDSLVPNPAVIHFPIWALHVLPPTMHHTLVCLGLNHYIHSLPEGSNRALVAGNRLKIYKYRGLAIRALSENVARETTRSTDLTISSILMFLAMEVRVIYNDSSSCKLMRSSRFKIPAPVTGDHMHVV